MKKDELLIMVFLVLVLLVGVICSHSLNLFFLKITGFELKEVEGSYGERPDSCDIPKNSVRVVNNQKEADRLMEKGCNCEEIVAGIILTYRCFHPDTVFNEQEDCTTICDKCECRNRGELSSTKMDIADFFEIIFGGYAGEFSELFVDFKDVEEVSKRICERVCYCENDLDDWWYESCCLEDKDCDYKCIDEECFDETNLNFLTDSENLVSLGCMEVCEEESVQGTAEEIIERLFSGGDSELREAVLSLQRVLENGKLISNAHMQKLVDERILEVYEKEIVEEYRLPGFLGLIFKKVDKKTEKARIMRTPNMYFVFKEKREEKRIYTHVYRISKGWELFAVKKNTYSLDEAVRDRTKELSIAEKNAAFSEFILHLVPFGRASDLGFLQGEWGTAGKSAAIDGVLFVSAIGPVGKAGTTLFRVTKTGSQACYIGGASYFTGSTGVHTYNTMFDKSIFDGQKLGPGDIITALYLVPGTIRGIRLVKGKVKGVSCNVARRTTRSW